MNITWNSCLKKYLIRPIKRLVSCFYLLIIQATIYADKPKNVIPVSQADKTDEGSDYMQTFKAFFQNEFLPLVMIVAGSITIYYAITLVLGGLQQSKQDKTGDALKSAVLWAALTVVVVGSLIYLLTHIQNWG